MHNRRKFSQLDFQNKVERNENLIEKSKFCSHTTDKGNKEKSGTFDPSRLCKNRNPSKHRSIDPNMNYFDPCLSVPSSIILRIRKVETADFSPLESHGVTWSHMESRGATWSHAESHGVKWSQLKSSGVSWSQVESCKILAYLSKPSIEV